MPELARAVMFLALLVGLSAAASCANRRPIVMIPGLFSSILENKVNVAKDYEPWKWYCDRTKDWFRNWVTIKDGVPFLDECYMHYMSSVWNATSRRIENLPGIESRVPEFGSTYAIDTLDPWYIVKYPSEVFHDLIKKFEKLGYEDGVDMLGAPYDWRYFSYDTNPFQKAKDNNWFEKAKELIEKTHKETGKKVVIISHSMGGLMTFKLLDYVGEAFAKEHLEMWICMSAPFLGAVKAVAAAFPGDNLGLPLHEDLVRKLARTIETIPFLFPQHDDAYPDGVMMIKSTGKVYQTSQYAEMLDLVHDADMKDHFTTVLNGGIVKLLETHGNSFPHGVPVHCAYTSGVETANRVVMETEDFDGKFTLEYGDGDGTVNLVSLESCRAMGAADVAYLGKHDHTGILDDKVSYDYLKKFICPEN